MTGANAKRPTLAAVLWIRESIGMQPSGERGQLALRELLTELFGAPRYGDRYDVHRWDDVTDRDLADRIGRIIGEFRRVARVNGSWPSLWWAVAREPFETFAATFPDDDEEELRSYWADEFPQTKWLRIDAHEVDREQQLVLYPMGIPLIYRRSDEVVVVPAPWNDERRSKMCEFLDWLHHHVSTEVTLALKDGRAYHDRLEANLPLAERFGWFRRGDLWAASPNAEHFILSELTQAQRQAFAATAEAFHNAEPLHDLTANDYFKFVATCYAGAGYQGLDGLSPRQQYEKLADGRHDGLLDIDPRSAEALAHWLHRGSRGGHPWEIARGGNSTHISLFLHRDQHGYHLTLAGTAVSRAAETIRMALALREAGVPVGVRDVDLHKKRALGEDLIAIVPAPYVGAYPHTIQSLFPDDIPVHDHTSHDVLEEYPAGAERVRGLPLPQVQAAIADTEHSGGAR